MKNSIKTIFKENQNFNSFKKVFFIMLTLLFVQVSSLNASNGITPPKLAFDNGSAIMASNPVFTELMAILNLNRCLGITVTSTSIKDKYSFSSYAVGQLAKKNSTTLTSGSIQTEFSDRNNFQGAKTRETIEIVNTGSSNVVGVNVKMETWGNRTLILSNVVINKRRYGYFITGQITDGNRTIYYTIGIYENVCLY